MKPRVFIGSSSEGLPTADYVRKTLEKDFNCVVWNDGTVFGLSMSYFDSLLKAGSMFDFGILVATRDDKTKSREKAFDTSRDNVIFEFGLFIGGMGKFRTLILLEEGAILPSDMAGITVSQYVSGQSAAAAASLKKQLDTLRTHIKERSQLQDGKAVSVFISYSHRDEKLRIELGKHLSGLERQGIITTWHDRKIGAGSEWEGSIHRNLDDSRVILLLISSEFISSPYCYDVEMKRALERHDNRQALVIPIILRPISLEGTPFSKLQALPKDAKPITTWQNRDLAFVNVAYGLRDAIQDLVGIA